MKDKLYSQRSATDGALSLIFGVNGCYRILALEISDRFDGEHVSLHGVGKHGTIFNGGLQVDKGCAETAFAHYLEAHGFAVLDPDTLKALGFDDSDDPVSGCDTVDAICQSMSRGQAIMQHEQEATQ